MKIIINGTAHDVDGESITYEDVVRLAGKKGDPSVTYSGSRTADVRREGTMHVGSRVRLEDGMVFSAIHTGNA